MKNPFRGSLVCPQYYEDFELDDDFVKWCHDRNIDIRKKQKKTAENMLFQALFHYMRTKR